MYLDFHCVQLAFQSVMERKKLGEKCDVNTYSSSMHAAPSTNVWQPTAMLIKKKGWSHVYIEQKNERRRRKP